MVGWILNLSSIGLSRAFGFGAVQLFDIVVQADRRTLSKRVPAST
jgi:hypothetical protein